MKNEWISKKNLFILGQPETDNEAKGASKWFSIFVLLKENWGSNRMHLRCNKRMAIKTLLEDEKNDVENEIKK